MHSTRVTRHIEAPRPSVYRALVDPEAVAAWRVPDGMTAEVHEFDARRGGRFRISLTYRRATGRTAGPGKTEPGVDTYHGHFEQLVPDERVVEVLEFETTEPGLQGRMRITTTLADGEGGTDLVMVHDGIPEGVAPADNETGTRMALANLARLVEAGDPLDP